MSDRYLPFSSDDLERDMQDRQSCRVCGRTCSSTVGVCRSPVCTSALVERLEQQLAALREALEKLARLGNGDRYGNSEGNVIAQNALALQETPHD